MFLEYFALGLLLLVLTGVFYIFIYIHDIPYHVAEHRHHPHKDAIYWSCWVSLFTLHALWPFLFIWASTNPMPAGAHVTGAGQPPDDASDHRPDPSHPAESAELIALRQQVTELTERLAAMERGISKGGDAWSS